MRVDELQREVETGAIDTVLLVMTDMQGRLMGKRMHAPFFLSDIAEHGAEGCNYLLAVDVEMNTVQGYEMSSWDTGYGDFVFKPDMSTLRPIPWLERTALVVADLEWHDGTPVVASPRQILRRQLDRLAERGWTANVGSELEFFLFRDSYDGARAKRYHDLTPANPYNVDYSIFGTTVVEEVLRPIRLGMAGAGIPVEDSKGECNFGQHEVNFRYAGRAGDGRQPLDLQERRPRDRLAARTCALVHGQVQRARGELVPHPLLVLGRERQPVPRRPQRLLQDVRALRGRPGDRHPRAGVHVRAQHQLLQALRMGLVRAHRHGLGARQPHLRLPRRRPWQRPSAGDAAGRRRRQPLPRIRGRDRVRPARDRQRAGAGARVRGQRVRGAARTGTSRARCATPSTCSTARLSPARRSARRWCDTTCTAPAPSSAHSTRRSPTGRSSGGSSGSSWNQTA